MKSFFATITIIFLCLALPAQDQIFKKDNTKVDAKILEINPTEVRYKLFTYQDGPTIVISKSDVALIIYQNGSHEVFSEPARPQQMPLLQDYREYARAERIQREEEADKKRKEEFEQLTSTRQVVFLNLLESLNGGIGVSYMREFANHYLNVFVPVSVGIAEPGITNSLFGTSYQSVNNFRYTRKVIDIGLGVNLQTNTKRAVTHFFGPLVGMNQYNGSYKTYIYDYYTYSNTQIIPHTFVANNYYFMINNGLLFRITKNFNFMIHAAFGFQQTVFLSGDPAKAASTNPNYYNNGSNGVFYPFNSAKVGFELGYRF